MALIIQTRSHAMPRLKGHEADGMVWHTISDSVIKLIGSRLEVPGGSFPQLSRLRAGAGVEFVGEQMLEALILECERMPGRDVEFRDTLGRLHNAACQAFAADLVVRCEPVSPAT